MQRPRDSTSETRQWADGGGRSSGAWCLVAALGSSWRVGVMLFSKSGETLEPPSPLHSAWSLRSAPLGAWKSQCFRSRGKPRTPFPLRSAWSLRSAPLGAWTSCCFRSRGKPPNPRLRCARLLLARGCHVVFEVGGNPRTPVFAALGLVAALGSSWRVDVMLFSKSGETPEPPSPLRSAWSLRWTSSGCWTAWRVL